ncbi:PP2C family protein-serine/threonine phosphatase [Tautonia plasticadhaerens]|uniref:PP2C family protein-serine/threonine phosphatase n=1 Tax=Tautonia plasticadhaerens TaxID=2527974 RepID=UPI0018D208C6|nr:SpoIIE family protein phosphatase [Tautonia plasticadhaerens]
MPHTELIPPTNETPSLLVGTDGIWETRSPDGVEFGKDRLREVIRDHRDAPSQQIADAITAALLDYRGDGHQDDDITFVLVKLV